MTGKRLFVFAVAMRLGTYGLAEDMTPGKIFEKVEGKEHVCRH